MSPSITNKQHAILEAAAGRRDGLAGAIADPRAAMPPARAIR